MVREQSQFSSLALIAFQYYRESASSLKVPAVNLPTCTPMPSPMVALLGRPLLQASIPSPSITSFTPCSVNVPIISHQKKSYSKHSPDDTPWGGIDQIVTVFELFVILILFTKFCSKLKLVSTTMPNGLPSLVATNMLQYQLPT